MRYIRDAKGSQQNRQAALEEMISNIIAHQWRQPLTTLRLSVQKLEVFYDMGGFSKELFESECQQFDAGHQAHVQDHG